ncbi:uncharacterized protein LTR77_007746 [Saxophila tyrrhenica]|uniref:WW domain-containing protein n=1 Tax=Saxophila tyrrhenica TaxID=1690608 RepID=A0AAV9P5Y1_9PEZI|nr:hypothetical protein LTR77_007746 [Saxophila tyrrhenica]
MESPNKRLKPSPPENMAKEDDFVPLNFDDEDNTTEQYGYGATSPSPGSATGQGMSNSPFNAPRGPQATQPRRDHRNDPRHAKDRPKSAHPLPGHEPWVLVKTKYGRYFVHNKDTRESLWRTPAHLKDAVREHEQGQTLEAEKLENAKWAEEQLKAMRQPEKAVAGREDEGRNAQDSHNRARRRRSESLQREDEEALMAEMAAEAEHAEEKDAKDAVKGVEGLQPKTVEGGAEAGYGSDSSYGEVEVTDSEFEDDDEGGKETAATAHMDGADQKHEGGPVEFGEDDIAWQLAAMEEDQDLGPNQDGGDDDDAADYEEEYDEADEDGASDEEAVLLFREMLDEHKISPFAPWDKLLNNEDILYDDRYTLLPNTRTRKAVWEEWVKETAARLKEERAKAEQLDPRIPYLAFLAEKATPKLYWPEFKRKYRKEAVMNERKLGDKEREKLYRDHIARLKLPESARKADLVNLLSSLPPRTLNRDTGLDVLPNQLLSHLHFISLPAAARVPIISKHISSLPPAPTNAEAGEIDAEAEKKRDDERKRREKALAEREKKVEEDRRKAEKEGRWAKREAREAEREVREATLGVGNRGLREQLRSG